MRKQLDVMPGNKPPASQIAAMAKKSEQPPLSSWDVFKVAKRSVRLGAVEAPDKQAAIEKGAQEFKTEAWRLYAVGRR
jgi:hypothetical protein